MNPSPFYYSKIKPAGSYRYDGEHGVSLGASEEDVDEGDDLQRFSQAHAVCQDTAESTAAAEALHRLHQVIVQKTDSPNLRRRKRQHKKSRESETPGSGFMGLYKIDIKGLFKHNE